MFFITSVNLSVIVYHLMKKNSQNSARLFVPYACPIPTTAPLRSLLVSVAEQTTLSIKSIAQRNRRRDRTKVDLKVESHVGAGVVVRLHRAADLVVSDLEVELLPLPVDVVDVGVVHVEEGLWG